MGPCPKKKEAKNIEVREKGRKEGCKEMGKRNVRKPEVERSPQSLPPPGREKVSGDGVSSVRGVGEPWATSLLGGELHEKERSKKGGGGQKASLSPILTSILLRSASSPVLEVPGGGRWTRIPPLQG